MRVVRDIAAPRVENDEARSRVEALVQPFAGIAIRKAREADQRVRPDQENHLRIVEPDRGRVPVAVQRLRDFLARLVDRAGTEGHGAAERGHEAAEERHGRGRRREISTKIAGDRSEEHTSELQSLMRISYAVFCLKKK